MERELSALGGQVSHVKVRMLSAKEQEDMPALARALSDY